MKVTPEESFGHTQAFQDLKVLDFCWVAIGPMTTRYFSDFGATVVRIESVHRPDVLRQATPYGQGKPGINRSAYYANYNSGKLSLSLNMMESRGRELALQLATWADVITENYTPGVMERWGLGYEDIQSFNPSVIMFSASMQGRGGPFSSHPGFGPVLTALSGHTHMTGWPDRAPTSPYGAYTDFLLPQLAIAAIAAALDYRRRTGIGQHLDMSQLEGSMGFMATALLDFAVNGRIQNRTGNLHQIYAPHSAYPCRGTERWCAIACRNEEEWRQLCHVLTRQDLATDPRFNNMELRKRNEKALDIEISSCTQQMDANDLMRLCQESGIPAGVVQNCEDLFGDPQLQFRKHYVFQNHPEIGRHAYDGHAFTLPESPPNYKPAPLLGEHTTQICRDILGMSDSEIGKLLDAGILS